MASIAEATTVVNIRGMSQADLDRLEVVYVGRKMPRDKRPAVKAGSPFCNPRLDLRGYLAHVRSRPDLLAQLPTLRGKRLACWCCNSCPATDRGAFVCHAEILALLADGLDPDHPGD